MTADVREELGRVVRATWVAWAREQPDPKASWLTGWDDLDRGQQEVDMRIAVAVVRAYWPEVQDLHDTQARIEDLKEFEREYRARLRSYHQQRLDELDGKNSP